ncbi:MAG: ATP-binding cassette domain-containing protein [Gammaproteobacteria bacterium]|nr:ATP-binding cassette domain-containing protein [Gammaproteobacteria bacterium]
MGNALEGNALEIANLQFAWRPGAANVLNIDKFTVRCGERVFIEGASGSGKSTLLSAVGGVVKTQAGAVLLLGTDLGGLSARQRDSFRADHVGIVFQMFNLVPYLSVLDNVTLPCRFSERRLANARRNGALRDEALRLLSALELDEAAYADRLVTDLSIGQQQRVAAARALIGTPELIMADEPTSALDEGTRERFLELLFAECEQSRTTVLFVSHDARLASLFDRRVNFFELNTGVVRGA